MTGHLKAPRYCTPNSYMVNDDELPDEPIKFDNQKLFEILDKQNAAIDDNERDSLGKHIARSIRLREIVTKAWAKNRLSADDIIELIKVARDANDLDEAVWRSFLAAHFGRSTASSKITNQVESAVSLLYGFGTTPQWTWKVVISSPDALRNWLLDHTEDLHSLSFGNHRKYESQQPDLLWDVVESFVVLATKFGGPSGLIESPAGRVESESFDVLYRRLKPIRRFGRTGQFDFLVLMLDLGLINARPRTCYLQGATGPKRGAIRLWGKRPTKELDRLSAELARRLDVSPIVIEDALCNWQK